VDDGWACLEIGGGAGSITNWLCSRVGAGGRVLATDDLPEAQFDPVHARLVLSRLPQRDSIISNLVQPLKPGGWLLIEEFDQAIAGLADPASDPVLVAILDKLDAILRGVASLQMIAEPITTGMGDVNFGRRLYGIMQRHGLERIVVEGHCSIAPGGSP
jgi:ubiquinone/menaquinone biosynthesis C-methylase UbiE